MFRRVPKISLPDLPDIEIHARDIKSWDIAGEDVTREEYWERMGYDPGETITFFQEVMVKIYPD